jgi:hypothetical protein
MVLDRAYRCSADQAMRVGGNSAILMAANATTARLAGGKFTAPLTYIATDTTIGKRCLEDA